MAGHVQYIKTPNGEEMAVLPRAEFERMRKVFEESLAEAEEDRLALKAYARVQAGEEESFPDSFVKILLDGTNKVKAFREYRGLTQKELAAKAGINPVYLSQIERGKRTGSVETLKAIASVLRVEVDDLID